MSGFVCSFLSHKDDCVATILSVLLMLEVVCFVFVFAFAVGVI